MQQFAQFVTGRACTTNVGLRRGRDSRKSSQLGLFHDSRRVGRTLHTGNDARACGCRRGKCSAGSALHLSARTITYEAAPSVYATLGAHSTLIGGILAVALAFFRCPFVSARAFFGDVFEHRAVSGINADLTDAGRRLDVERVTQAAAAGLVL